MPPPWWWHYLHHGGITETHGSNTNTPGGITLSVEAIPKPCWLSLLGSWLALGMRSIPSILLQTAYQWYGPMLSTHLYQDMAVPWRAVSANICSTICSCLWTTYGNLWRFHLYASFSKNHLNLVLMFSRSSDVRKRGHVVRMFTRQSDVRKRGHVILMFTRQSDVRKRVHVVLIFTRQSEVRKRVHVVLMFTRQSASESMFMLSECLHGSQTSESVVMLS